MADVGEVHPLGTKNVPSNPFLILVTKKITFGQKLINGL